MVYEGPITVNPYIDSGLFFGILKFGTLTYLYKHCSEVGLGRHYVRNMVSFKSHDTVVNSLLVMNIFLLNYDLKISKRMVRLFLKTQPQVVSATVCLVSIA